MWDSYASFVAISTSILTFNSLCEIPTCHITLPFSQILFFQFSMWDSALGYDRACQDIRSFNSLCEIQVIACYDAILIELSFQFSMWDSRQDQGEGHRLIHFQFSMWDSWPLSSFLLKNPPPLSILYVRFLRPILASCPPDGVVFFQFSMWDSSWSLVKGLFWSKPFNSLCEILWQ